MDRIGRGGKLFRGLYGRNEQDRRDTSNAHETRRMNTMNETDATSINVLKASGPLLPTLPMPPAIGKPWPSAKPA